MQTTTHSLPAMICLVFLFCTAVAVVSPAQSVFFTTLASFDGPDGSQPYAGLVQGTDGNFYGTTQSGGDLTCDAPFGCGTVFKISLTDTLTTLYVFGSAYGGGSPQAGLVQATDGNFYGTTVGGGQDDAGTVFKITPEGEITTLHSFGMLDGCDPAAKLVQATDGNFYGTTSSCGPIELYSNGTIFKITPSGELSTLYSFCDQNGCPDGCETAGLVQARDGNLYGTTSSGGADIYGTVFKISPSRTLTAIYSFCPQPNCADGAEPTAELIQGSDGDFYGTTTWGGSGNYCEGSGCGTVFKITPSGTLTTLHSFNGTDGNLAYKGLVQATDGFLYGTTYSGGTNNDGTVFGLGVVHACMTCRP